MSMNEGSDRDETDNKHSVLQYVEDENSDLADTLPEKSRIVYNSAYNKFIEWKKTEDKLLSEQLLLDYFHYLHNVQKRKPSTLWSIYSMLKMTIKTNDKINIGKYKKLNVYLKEQSIGYESKKTKSLTSSDVERFLNEAPDEKYLAVKVSLIFAIIGACRREELCNITMNDIEDDGIFALIKIRNPDTEIERSFTIVDEFYSIYKKYASLRPKHAKTDRFFMQYSDGKCTQQVIGLNKFGSMPKLIASWLKLPDAENYTGHSFRRSSAILLADSGPDLLSSRPNSTFKIKVAKCCAKDSLNKKKRLSEQIMKTVILKSSSEASAPNLRPSTSLTPATLLNSTSLPLSSDTFVISATSSLTHNFETIYLPVEQECEDNNSEETRDINPFMDKDKSESSSKIETPVNIRIKSSGQLKKVTNPLGHHPAELKKIQSTTAPSAPAAASHPKLAPPSPLESTASRAPVPQTVLPTPIPSPQQGVPPKALLLRTVPLKVAPITPTSTSPVQLSQKPVSQSSLGVCLRWKSYHSNMQNSFPSLLNSEDFVDVTLACEGKSIKCHKIILSSCSDYLGQLLRENPCSHPIILMKDLKFWEIDALVQFMYKGEIHIAQEQLPQLLNAAKALEIKGLAGFTLTKVQKRTSSVPEDKLQISKSAVPQESLAAEPKAFHKLSVTEHQKAPSNSISSVQINEKRSAKRPLEITTPKSIIKIRRQCTKLSRKLHGKSPVIQCEPRNLPSTPSGNNSHGNYENSSKNYIDLVEMHEENDGSGGDEKSNIDQRDAEDIDDCERQMEFISTEFLDDEQEILNVIDHESCSSSLIDTESEMKFVAGDILEMEDDIIDGPLGETSNNTEDTDTLIEEIIEDDDANKTSKEKDET